MIRRHLSCFHAIDLFDDLGNDCSTSKSRDSNGLSAVIDRAFNYLVAFLQISSMWMLNFNF